MTFTKTGQKFNRHPLPTTPFPRRTPSTCPDQPNSPTSFLRKKKKDLKFFKYIRLSVFEATYNKYNVICT